MSRSGRPISRRQALGIGIGVAGATALAACSTNPPAATPASTPAHPPAPSTAGTTSSTPAPVPGAPAVQVVRGSGSRPEVALTFHGAGELSIAQQVLAALAAANAKATVLAVGTWLAATPDGIRMVRDAGHEIGNHTWSHGNMAAMAADPTLVEIERCRDELAKLVGTPGDFFRQSDAQYPTERELVAAGKAGYSRVLSYDIDALDWKDPGPEVIRRAVAAATAGSVVSMHFGHPGTVAALPGILRDLAGRGLTPVTASELLR